LNAVNKSLFKRSSFYKKNKGFVDVNRWVNLLNNPEMISGNVQELEDLSLKNLPEEILRQVVSSL